MRKLLLFLLVLEFHFVGHIHGTGLPGGYYQWVAVAFFALVSVCQFLGASTSSHHIKKNIV